MLAADSDLVQKLFELNFNKKIGLIFGMKVVAFSSEIFSLSGLKMHLRYKY